MAFDSTEEAEGENGTDVVVEAEYVVGEFQITVLSAEQSNSLLRATAKRGV